MYPGSAAYNTKALGCFTVPCGNRNTLLRIETVLEHSVQHHGRLLFVYNSQNQGQSGRFLPKSIKNRIDTPHCPTDAGYIISYTCIKSKGFCQKSLLFLRFFSTLATYLDRLRQTAVKNRRIGASQGFSPKKAQSFFPTRRFNIRLL